jgi:hypothetical protein
VKPRKSKGSGLPSPSSSRCSAAWLPTIQATYNRYGYLREKREAFDKLAELIGQITATHVDNVVALRR